MEDASYFTEFTNMCLKNTEIFDVNAFFLGWHDWVCHMARCWKSIFWVSCNHAKVSLQKLISCLEAFHTTHIGPLCRLMAPHSLPMDESRSRIAPVAPGDHPLWQTMDQHFVFRKWIFKVSLSWKTRVSPLKRTFLECKNFPFFVPPSQWKPSQASQRLQELLLHPWVVPALSTTQVGVPFVGIFWVWPGAKTRIYLHTSAAQEWQTKWDVQQKRLEDLRFWKREDTFSTRF